MPYSYSVGLSILISSCALRSSLQTIPPYSDLCGRKTNFQPCPVQLYAAYLDRLNGNRILQYFLPYVPPVPILQVRQYSAVSFASIWNTPKPRTGIFTPFDNVTKSIVFLLSVFGCFQYSKESKLCTIKVLQGTISEVHSEIYYTYGTLSVAAACGICRIRNAF